MDTLTLDQKEAVCREQAEALQAANPSLGFVYDDTGVFLRKDGHDYIASSWTITDKFIRDASLDGGMRMLRVDLKLERKPAPRS